MKLIIQIPCFNEEQSLPITLAALPRQLPGIDCIEVLVIDDGSSDRTAEAARSHGADHILSLSRHMGLARAFILGIEHALRLGADLIVNTDADNQYCAEDIAKLVFPVLAGHADIVIGARPIAHTRHFSPAKKLLQSLGSRVVRLVSGASVADAPSGFRAFSREAAASLRVFTRYSYTIETIIQASQNGFRILSIPIRTNPDLRPSRLATSTLHYVLRSAETILRVFAVYYPFRFFLIFSLLSGGCGFALGLRFLYYFFGGHGHGHIQSLLLAVIFFAAAFVLFAVAVLADVMAVNRKLLEKIDARLTQIQSCDIVCEPDIRGQGKEVSRDEFTIATLK